MRNEPNLRVDNYRLPSVTVEPSPRGCNGGAFAIPGKFGTLRVISSGSDLYPDAEGWEHVSVSYTNGTPSWEDMDKVKRLFWKDEETVVQFHPAESAKINQHPHTLHLWKPVNSNYVLPPAILV